MTLAPTQLLQEKQADGSYVKTKIDGTQLQWQVIMFKNLLYIHICKCPQPTHNKLSTGNVIKNSVARLLEELQDAVHTPINAASCILITRINSSAHSILLVTIHML
jgi:hypothetical protein